MIKIITFGEFKDKESKSIADDFLKRINKYHKTEVITLKEETKKTINENLKLEQKLIEKHLGNGLMIVLDKEGTQYSSESFSEVISKGLSNFADIYIIIGSSNGLDPEIKRRSNMVISFSKMTFPHLIFRIMLLEQIYRGFKILNNERYHK